jgi:hypothetical protein
MPVTVRKGSGARPWKIVEKESGKVVGSSTTKAKAEAPVTPPDMAGSLKRNE